MAGMLSLHIYWSLLSNTVYTGQSMTNVASHEVRGEMFPPKCHSHLYRLASYGLPCSPREVKNVYDFLLNMFNNMHVCAKGHMLMAELWTIAHCIDESLHDDAMIYLLEKTTFNPSHNWGSGLTTILPDMAHQIVW